MRQACEYHYAVLQDTERLGSRGLTIARSDIDLGYDIAYLTVEVFPYWKDNNGWGKITLTRSSSTVIFTGEFHEVVAFLEKYGAVKLSRRFIDSCVY